MNPDPWLVRWLPLVRERAGGTPVLELGCGRGQDTLSLVEAGLSVVALAGFYKILPDEILVVHDELDLSPGDIRIKQGGGNGGHNGLKDIQAHLSVPDFWRLRIGIGHPGERSEVINYVLKAPRKEEQALIDRALDRCLLAWPKFAAGDFAAAQRLLHRKDEVP